MIDAELINVSAAPTRLFGREIVDCDGYVLRLVSVLAMPTKWCSYKKSSVASRCSARDWAAPPVRWNGGVLPSEGSLALYRCEGRYFVWVPIDGYTVPWPRPELELIPVPIYAGTGTEPADDDAAVRVVAETMANAIEYIEAPGKNVADAEVCMRFRWQHHDFDLIKELYTDGSAAANLVWICMSRRESIGRRNFGLGKNILDLWAAELKSGDDVMRCFGVEEILREPPGYMVSRVRRRKPVTPGTVGWRWGQLLAIIDSVTPLSPDALREAVHQPGKWFGPLMEQAGPLVPKRLRRALRYIGDSVLDVADWPERLAGADAADAWSGMYWFKHEYFD